MRQNAHIVQCVNPSSSCKRQNIQKKQTDGKKRGGVAGTGWEIGRGKARSLMLKLKTKIKNFAIDIDIHTTLRKVKKNKV